MLLQKLLVSSSTEIWRLTQIYIDTAELDCGEMLREMTYNLKRDIHGIVQEIGKELKVIRQKASRWQQSRQNLKSKSTR